MKKLNTKISKILKNLRQEKGWSLDIASEETGVSKAMLGQIERGESSPTIATLWKIASGFQTSFSSFLEDDAAESATTIRKTLKSRKVQSKDSKIKITSIFPYDKKLSFELFSIELSPGCEHLSSSHKGGVIEHLVVIEGQMEVLVNEKWHKLKTGEGLRFNASAAHGYRNKSQKKSVFHNIIHYSK